MPKLPKFKTEKELADFVDTHNTVPYWKGMTPMDTELFRIKRRRQTSVRLSMSQAKLKRLQGIAAQRGVSTDDLLHRWLSQKLQQEQMIA